MREPGSRLVAGVVCAVILCTVVAGVAAGQAARGRRHIPGACHGVVKTAGFWTPPLFGTNTFRQTGVGCKAAKRLAKRMLPGGIAGLPHPADRTKWRCRFITNADVPYVDCQ